MAPTEKKIIYHRSETEQVGALHPPPALRPTTGVTHLPIVGNYNFTVAGHFVTLMLTSI